MKWRKLLRRETESERWDRWHREHRWDALADYNNRLHKGIVHTPEYTALMQAEQAIFDAQHGFPARNGQPVTLDAAL